MQKLEYHLILPTWKINVRYEYENPFKNNHMINSWYLKYLIILKGIKGVIKLYVHDDDTYKFIKIFIIIYMT